MTVLQILPEPPGSFGGVADYAFALARALRADHKIDSLFAVASSGSAAAPAEFPITSDLNSLPTLAERVDHVILHYANYGYARRGVPFRLRNIARALRRNLRGRWITTFHELFASGPPWRSAFWLQPLQKAIARDLVTISDLCVVSSDVIEREVRAFAAGKPIQLLPVMSNFGEPLPSSLGDERSERRWAICGGTKLLARSLRSFSQTARLLPPYYFPQQIEVIGGREDVDVRDAIARLRATSCPCDYHPQVDAQRGSELLSACSFAWIDYFGNGKVWPGIIFKSGSFAACCANGAIPVLSHAEPPPPLGGDAFPGWFFIAGERVHLPEPAEIGNARQQIAAWYHRNASAKRTARAYADALA